MRDTALTALLELYSDKENHSPLHGFTARFQKRFAELVYDIDEAVAVKGVQLVTMLVQAEEMPQDEVKGYMKYFRTCIGKYIDAYTNLQSIWRRTGALRWYIQAGAVLIHDSM